MLSMEIHVWTIKNDTLPTDKTRANQIFFWDAGDSAEVFERNKTDPKMDKIYLEGEKITYIINSHGYRTKNFDQFNDNEFILVLGCSHTYGTALHEQHIWHSYLGEYLGLPVMNLGNAGFGPDYVFTMSTLYNKFNMPKPKMVVIQWPQKFRKSFTYDINGSICLDPTHPDIEDIDKINHIEKEYDTSWYFNRYITYTDEMEKNNFVNYSATQLLWNCPVFNWSWEDDYENAIEETFLKVHTEDLGRARDLEHDGRLTHLQAAKQVYRGMQDAKMV